MPPHSTYRHRVTLDEPSGPIPDGEGGYTEGFAPLAPAQWFCSIEPASVRDLENIGGGTVIAQASHVVKGRYHAGITTKTRLHFKGRVLNVVYVANVDERSIETNLVCSELIE